MLFPTDLASFLDLIRQHGDASYSFMFAYATSHSLLFALFAGYAAHAGALKLGTLIAVCWFGSFTGDAIRFWIGRRRKNAGLGQRSDSGAEVFGEELKDVHRRVIANHGAGCDQT